ncbi:thermonuclease family protein [Legionella septentrionalis]|uniref:thermonuclease family protein n=1 Tax=Legionella septentrionalis TaxID=2498109 RepID=UPI0018F7A9A6|nr:thermonuclease family protein [Legionella septentrionalis]
MHKRIVLLLLIICFSVQAKTITGEVIKIADGDTLTILTNTKQQERIRLIEIDAPEKHQAFGNKSRQSLAALCFKQLVVIHYDNRDRYGRILGRVFCNGIDANKDQIRNGMAWVYVKYAKDNSLFAIEKEARNKKIGLWQDQNPIAPWIFRRKR